MGGCASNLDCCCLHCHSGGQGSGVKFCCFGCSSSPEEERCDWPLFKCWSGTQGSGVRACLCFSCSCGKGSSTKQDYAAAQYPETGAAAPTAPSAMIAPQQQSAGKGGMYPAVNKF